MMYKRDRIAYAEKLRGLETWEIRKLRDLCKQMRIDEKVELQESELQRRSAADE